MVRIERLRIQLPAAYQQRAGSIGNLAGRELGEQLAGLSVTTERLAAPRIRIAAGATDHDIARSIVNQIVKRLRSGK